jgi:fibronectin type 3 domain-containing protein
MIAFFLLLFSFHTNVAVPQGAHSVTLSWTPSSSTQRLSYRVYRSTAVGQELNQTPLATGVGMGNGGGTTPVTYTDTTVIGGTTYYYEVVAVDAANGAVSLPSNEATGKVPLAPPSNVKVISQ